MAARKKKAGKKAAKKARTRAPQAKRGISAIQTAIKTKKFDWQAADNPISRMSRDQQKVLLGYHADETELRSLERYINAANAFQTRLSTAFTATPSSLDWRSNSGNWMTPIRDQQSCGSCVSFASLATIEARMKIECRDASLQPDYSEAFLFFCGCGNCCGSGWNFAPSLDFCKNTGFAQESSWPYQPQDQACRSGIPIAGQISSWKRALSQEERFESLSETGPMIAGLAVYSDFSSYQSGIYRQTSTTLDGYHAVCVVGYDKAEKYWICKNSWGPGWGENGYFRIGFGESGIDTTFPFYEVQLSCTEQEPEVDRCRRYVPYLVRVIRVASTNPSFRRCLKYYVCRTGPRPPRCSAAYLRVIRTVERILQACPQYRRPFCAALE